MKTKPSEEEEKKNSEEDRTSEKEEEKKKLVCQKLRLRGSLMCLITKMPLSYEL